MKIKKGFPEEVIKVAVNVGVSISELNQAFIQLSKIVNHTVQCSKDASGIMRTAIKDYRRMLKVREAEKLHARGHSLRNLIIGYELQLMGNK